MQVENTEFFLVAVCYFKVGSCGKGRASKLLFFQISHGPAVVQTISVSGYLIAQLTFRRWLSSHIQNSTDILSKKEQNLMCIFHVSILLCKMKLFATYKLPLKENLQPFIFIIKSQIDCRVCLFCLLFSDLVVCPLEHANALL